MCPFLVMNSQRFAFAPPLKVAALQGLFIANIQKNAVIIRLWVLYPFLISYNTKVQKIYDICKYLGNYFTV